MIKIVIFSLCGFILHFIFGVYLLNFEANNLSPVNLTPEDWLNYAIIWLIFIDFLVFLTPVIWAFFSNKPNNFNSISKIQKLPAKFDYLFISAIIISLAAIIYFFYKFIVSEQILVWDLVTVIFIIWSSSIALALVCAAFAAPKSLKFIPWFKRG